MCTINPKFHYRTLRRILCWLSCYGSVRDESCSLIIYIVHSGFSWSLQHHLWYTSCNIHPCRQYRTQGTIICILSQRRHRLLFVIQVTVALIDLSPELSYTSVPRLSPHSFLQAKAKNTSHYAMLAGPSNIFLDNNFIAKV